MLSEPQALRCLSCYANENTYMSIYHKGPVGTIFSALKALLIFYSQFKEFQKAKKKIGICRTAAQKKVFQEYFKNDLLIDTENLKDATLRGFAKFIVSTPFLAWQCVRYYRMISQQQIFYGNILVKSTRITSLAIELAVADLVIKKNLLPKSKEIIFCTDHNALVISICIQAPSNYRLSFLPHGANIGKDNDFRSKDIFSKIYSWSLIQYLAMFSRHPEIEHVKLTKNARLWKVNETNSLINRSQDLVYVIWLTQLDFFHEIKEEFWKNLNHTADLIRDEPGSVILVRKGATDKELKDVIDFLSKTKPLKIRVIKNFLEFQSLRNSDVLNYKHVVIRSGVSAELVLLGDTIYLGENNPLIEDTITKNIVSKWYETIMVNENPKIWYLFRKDKENG